MGLKLPKLKLPRLSLRAFVGHPWTKLAAFVLVVGMGVVGLWVLKDFIDDNRALIERMEQGFLKECERDNLDDSEIADAIHKQFDSSADSRRELEIIAEFDDALSPKDCQAFVLSKKSAPPVVEVANQPVPVTARVPGVDGPAVRVGGIFESNPRICVRVPGGVIVNAQINWIELDADDRPIRLVPGIALDFPLEEGCNDIPSAIPLGDGLTPGRWIISARLQAPDRLENRVPSFVVVTEPFEVVP